jgi:hypothetical protein
VARLVANQMQVAVKIAGPSILFVLLTAASSSVSSQTVSGAEPDPSKGSTFSRPLMQPETQRIVATSRYCVTPNNGWCDLVGAAVGSRCECADDDGKLYSGIAR